MHRRLTRLKALTTAVLFVVAMLTMAGCDEGGKYEVKNGTVYFTYWTFSFGTVEEELTGVDPATFESVNDWIGRDAGHVWFKSRLAEGADASTVVADDYPLFHDRHDYYFEGKAIGVADPSTFRALQCNKLALWAVDRQCAYFDTLRIDSADTETFKVVDTFTAKDRRHVYYFGKVLDDADPATFKSLGAYAKDRNHVWYCGDIVEGADVESFVEDNNLDADKPDAHDRNHKYKYGERI